MRTTIRIDDALYRAVKAKAARSGRTIAAVLEDAVRLGLEPPTAGHAGRFVVTASGSGGVRPDVDLSSNAAIRDVLDDEVALDALR